MTADDPAPERMAALEAELAETRAACVDLARRVAALEAPGAPPAKGADRFGAVYPAFQDQFRGPEDEITRRLSAYLPDVGRLVRSGGVVDVGPGRGEWLALLREHDVTAHGVDVNAACIATCRAKGLDVVDAPAARHLASLAPGSLDLVTAFHVVEHLGIEDLLELLDAAGQALRPGGGLLVETPNPTNVVMGACDFYNDPTHRSPLPPDLTAYLVGAAGFEDVEVRPLHPSRERRDALLAEAEGAPQPLLAETVAERFFGPQDYAVLGVRPGA